MGEAYLSILAYFLFGMTAIAIGLFLSSLTESQVIAAVLTFLVLFLGYMMDSIWSIISSTGNLLTKLLCCFDLYTPFSNLLNGTLNVSSIVYYVSVTALVLSLIHISANHGGCFVFSEYYERRFFYDNL